MQLRISHSAKSSVQKERKSEKMLKRREREKCPRRRRKKEENEKNVRHALSIPYPYAQTREINPPSPPQSILILSGVETSL
jgi:hypothetical protein